VEIFLNFRNKEIWQNIFIASVLYLFAICIKIFWIYTCYNTEVSVYEGVRLVNANDGLRWLQHAREIVSGLTIPSDGQGGFRPAATTAVFISSITGTDIDRIAFYLPIFLSSLSAIAVYLIGTLSSNPKSGVFAALFLSALAGFFSRTMPGYFDDDMLSLVNPLFVILSLLYTVKNKNITYVFAVFLSTSFTMWWYPQSAIFLAAIAIFTAMHLLCFDRKNIVGYIALTAIFIAIAPLSFLIKASIFALLPILNMLIKNNNTKLYGLWFLIVAGAVFGLVAYFGKIKILIESYILKSSESAEGYLSYVSIFTSGVSETKAMSVSDFVFFVSNNYLFFGFSVVGLILLIKKNREFLVLLPLLIFGFFALDGGNRFAAFAVAPLSVGFGFALATTIDKLSSGRLAQSNLRFIVGKKQLIIALSALFIFTNLKTVYSFRVPPAVSSYEIEFLKNLDTKLKNGDTVFSWWDFGSSVKYYTKATPHSDSSQNQGNRVFIEAAALTSSSQLFARNILSEASKIGFASTFENIASSSKAKQQNIYDFIDSLAQENYPLQQNDKNTYLVIRPKDIMGFGAIRDIYFGSLQGQKKSEKPIFLFSLSSSENNDEIILSGGVKISKTTFEATAQNGSKKAVKAFYRITSIGNGKSEFEKLELNPDGELNLINAAPLNAMILCDDETLNSNIIKMFVFGEYDKNYFETAIYKNGIKAFRLIGTPQP